MEKSVLCSEVGVYALFGYGCVIFGCLLERFGMRMGNQETSNGYGYKQVDGS